MCRVTDIAPTQIAHDAAIIANDLKVAKQVPTNAVSGMPQCGRDAGY